MGKSETIKNCSCKAVVSLIVLGMFLSVSPRGIGAQQEDRERVAPESPVGVGGQNVNRKDASANRPETLQVRLNASKPAIEVGENVITHAAVSGGIPPYQYEWFNGKRKSQIVTPNVVWAKLGSGTKSIRVVVTDSAGMHADASVEIVVNAPESAAAPNLAAKTAQEISRLIKPSDHDQEIAINKEVSLVVPSGALTKEQTITLAPLTSAPPNKCKGFTRLGAYRIETEANAFDKAVTLAFAYDPKLFAANSIPPEDAVAVSCWDGRVKEWRQVPFTVDKPHHLLKVKTCHLSDWAIDAMIGHFVSEEVNAVREAVDSVVPTVKNKVQYGLIRPMRFWWSGGSGASAVAVSAHFRIHFTAEQSRFDLSDERQAHLIPGTNLLDRNLTNIRISRNYLVFLVRDYLEQIYQNYVEAGFPPFDCKLDVYMEDLGGGSPHYSSWTGRMVIEQNPAGRDEMETRHEMAHELFHAFQDNDAGISWQGSKQNFKNLANSDWLANKAWFIEATADYAADKIAFSKNHPDGEEGERLAQNKGRETNRMGGTVLLESYLQKPITFFDERHEYWTAFFIKHLVDKGFSLKELWDAAKNSDGDGLLGLSRCVENARKGTLADQYNAFAREFMFGPAVMDPAKYKTMPAGVVNVHHLRRADDATSKSIPESVPGNCAAYLFEIKAKNRSAADKTRSIKVWVDKRGENAAFGSTVWPEAVNGQIYLAPEGRRCAAKRLATLDRDKGRLGPVTLEMQEESVAYILLTNGGRNNLPVCIEIQEAAAAPAPAPPVVPDALPVQKDKELQECTLRGFWAYGVTVSFYQGDQRIASTSYTAPKLACHVSVPPGKYRVVIKYKEFKESDPEKTITRNWTVTKGGVNNFSWELAY